MARRSRGGRASQRRSQGVLLVLLLACALGLAATLAYEAHDATRSHRAATERALHDYAAVAAWEFVRGAEDELQSRVRPALEPLTGTRAVSPYDLLPGPTVLAGAAATTLACDSASVDTARFYFRVDFRDRSLLTTGTALSSAMRQWLLDTVTAHGRTVYQPDWSFAVILGAPTGAAPSAIVYGVKYAEHRAPIAAFGFRTCPAAVGVPLFKDVAARRPLLPMTLTGRAPNDSIVTLSVADAHDREVFRAGVGALSAYSASAPLDQLGMGAARATIRHSAVELLALGAVPSTRVPALIALLLVTAAMIGVAVVQLRREHELARLRSDFISSVSHELRTPLSQILLFAETLELGRVRDESERRAATGVIVQESRRLMHLVDNVLHFSRAERGLARLDVGKVSLATEVAGVVDEWLATAGAATRVDVTAEEPVTAIADPGAVRQIMVNLLDNAAKYGPTSQTVRVRVTHENGRAVVTVDDQGPGVPVRERLRVWDSFYRLDRDAESAVAGSGIGLYVVRELARLQGGDARVEDAAGGGARFIVELPLDVAAAPAPDALTAPASSALEPRKVGV
ncbi:MAG TPA: HAMP domain-containing sensor histidine kinase [Gemmatimonadaceae bacterium]